MFLWLVFCSFSFCCLFLLFIFFFRAFSMHIMCAYSLQEARGKFHCRLTSSLCVHYFHISFDDNCIWRIINQFENSISSCDLIFTISYLFWLLCIRPWQHLNVVWWDYNRTKQNPPWWKSDESSRYVWTPESFYIYHWTITRTIVFHQLLFWLLSSKISIEEFGDIPKCNQRCRTLQMFQFYANSNSETHVLRTLG